MVEPRNACLSVPAALWREIRHARIVISFVILPFYGDSEEAGCPLDASKLLILSLSVTQNEAGHSVTLSCQMNLTRW